MLISLSIAARIGVRSMTWWMTRTQCMKSPHPRAHQVMAQKLSQSSPPALAARATAADGSAFRALAAGAGGLAVPPSFGAVVLPSFLGDGVAERERLLLACGDALWAPWLP